jgi:hypothetical protein
MLFFLLTDTDDVGYEEPTILRLRPKLLLGWSGGEEEDNARGWIPLPRSLEGFWRCDGFRGDVVFSVVAHELWKENESFLMIHV